MDGGGSEGSGSGAAGVRLGRKLRGRAGCGGEELGDFSIGGLGEVCIALADAAKIGRGFKGEKAIDQGTQGGAGLTGGEGDGDDDLARVLSAEGLDCGAKGGAGGDAVIDEDDGLAGDRGRGGMAAVGELPPKKLLPLDGGLGFESRTGDAEGAHDVMVNDLHTAAGDGAHGELRVAGDAELADDEDIERGVEFAGDLRGHGDAAAREGKHENVRAVCMLHERGGEKAAGVRAVAEGGRFHAAYLQWSETPMWEVNQ